MASGWALYVFRGNSESLPYESFFLTKPKINPNYGDEFRLKNAQLQDLEVIVDKEIANNVQTVPYTIGNGPDLKYALYNETRDAITDYDGEVLNAYEPEEPYEWLEDFWPEGFN